MTQKPDFEIVLNFLRGESLDVTPETISAQPAALDPVPENVELGDLRALGGFGAKDDETSSYQSAVPRAAPERRSVEIGDQRRVVKYVQRKFLCLQLILYFCRD